MNEQPVLLHNSRQPHESVLCVHQPVTTSAYKASFFIQGPSLFNNKYHVILLYDDQQAGLPKTKPPSHLSFVLHGVLVLLQKLCAIAEKKKAEEHTEEWQRRKSKQNRVELKNKLATVGWGGWWGVGFVILHSIQCVSWPHQGTAMQVCSFHFI